MVPDYVLEPSVTRNEHAATLGTKPNNIVKRKIKFPQVKNKRGQFMEHAAKSASNKTSANRAYNNHGSAERVESVGEESNTNSNPFELVKENMALRQALRMSNQALTRLTISNQQLLSSQDGFNATQSFDALHHSNKSAIEDEALKQTSSLHIDSSPDLQTQPRSLDKSQLENA